MVKKDEFVKRDPKVAKAIKTGQKILGVVCPHCGAPAPLVDPHPLPDLVRTQCPKCGEMATRPKSEVRTLVAHRIH